MADTQPIVYNVVIRTTSEGAADAQRQLQGVSRAIGRTQRAARDGFRSMGKFADANRDVAKATKRGKGSIDSVTTSFRGLRGVLGSTTSILGMFSSAIGVGANVGLVNAIRYTVQWNRELYASHRIFLVYGTSFYKLGKDIERFGKVLNVTRMDALELRKVFASSLVSPDFSKIEGLFKNISSITGKNTQEMIKFMGTLKSVSQVFPEFEKFIRSDFAGSLSEAAAAATKYQKTLQVALVAGRITVDQYKEASGGLEGMRKAAGGLTKEQKNAAEHAQALIDAQQEIATLIEDIKISIGNDFIPYLRDVAKGFEEWKSKIVTFSKYAVYAVAAFTGFAILGSVVANLTRMLSLVTAIRKTAGAGNLLGNMGGVGGKLFGNKKRGSVATNAIGNMGVQRVFVVNMGMGNGMGMGPGGRGSRGSRGLGRGASRGARMGAIRGAGRGNLLARGAALGGKVPGVGGRALVAGQVLGGRAIGAGAMLAGSSLALAGLGFTGAMGGDLGAGAAGMGIDKTFGKGSQDTSLGMAGRGVGAVAGGAALGAAFGGAPGAVIGAVAGGGKESYDVWREGQVVVKEMNSVLKSTNEDMQTHINLVKESGISWKIELETARQEMMKLDEEVIKAKSGFWYRFAGFGSGEIKALEKKASAARKALSEKRDKAVEGGQFKELEKSKKAEEEKTKELEKQDKLHQEEMETALQYRQIQDVLNSIIESRSRLLQSQMSLYSTTFDIIKMGGVGVAGSYAKSKDKLDEMTESLRQQSIWQKESLKNQEAAFAVSGANLSAAGQLDQFYKAKDAMDKAVGPEAKLKVIEGETIEIRKQIEAEATLIATREKIKSIDKEIISLETGFTALLDTRIQKQQSESSVLESQIQLADNFAMGVAASAEMRMQAVRAIGDVITEQRSKISVISEQMAKIASQEVNSLEEAEAQQASLNLLEIQRNETQNEILQNINKQAQMTRVLRDGWVSAINAMNNGVGMFTKIKIDQETRLGTLMERAPRPVVGIRTGFHGPGLEQSTRYSALAPGMLVNPNAAGRAFGAGSDKWANAIDQRMPLGFAAFGNMNPGAPGGVAQMASQFTLWQDVIGEDLSTAMAATGTPFGVSGLTSEINDESVQLIATAAREGIRDGMAEQRLLSGQRQGQVTDAIDAQTRAFVSDAVDVRIVGTNVILPVIMSNISKNTDTVVDPVYRAMGGFVPGSPSETRDVVPAMLVPGEFLIKKRAAEAMGPQLLSMINEGKITNMDQFMAAKSMFDSKKELAAIDYINSIDTSSVVADDPVSELSKLRKESLNIRMKLGDALSYSPASNEYRSAAEKLIDSGEISYMESLILPRKFQDNSSKSALLLAKIVQDRDVSKIKEQFDLATFNTTRNSQVVPGIDPELYKRMTTPASGIDPELYERMTTPASAVSARVAPNVSVIGPSLPEDITRPVPGLQVEEIPQKTKNDPAFGQWIEQQRFDLVDFLDRRHANERMEMFNRVKEEYSKGNRLWLSGEFNKLDELFADYTKLTQSASGYRDLANIAQNIGAPPLQLPVELQGKVAPVVPGVENIVGRDIVYGPSPLQDIRPIPPMRTDFNVEAFAQSNPDLVSSLAPLAAGYYASRIEDLRNRESKTIKSISSINAAMRRASDDDLPGMESQKKKFVGHRRNLRDRYQELRVLERRASKGLMVPRLEELLQQEHDKQYVESFADYREKSLEWEVQQKEKKEVSKKDAEKILPVISDSDDIFSAKEQLSPERLKDKIKETRYFRDLAARNLQKTQESIPILPVHENLMKPIVRLLNYSDIKSDKKYLKETQQRYDSALQQYNTAFPIPSDDLGMRATYYSGAISKASEKYLNPDGENATSLGQLLNNLNATIRVGDYESHDIRRGIEEVSTFLYSKNQQGTIPAYERSFAKPYEDFIAASTVDFSMLKKGNLDTFDIPNLAKGGLIKARTGGRNIRVAEGGNDEIVSPIPMLNTMIQDAMLGAASMARTGRTANTGVDLKQAGMAGVVGDVNRTADFVSQDMGESTAKVQIELSPKQMAHLKQGLIREMMFAMRGVTDAAMSKVITDINKGA